MVATIDIKELWTDWFATHSDSTRNAIVEHYMPLVETHACKISKRLPKCVDVHDLIQAGAIALMECITKFDPSRANFKTYAGRRVYGEMLDWLREQDIIPRLSRLRHNSIVAAETEHLATTGQLPTPRELQSRLGFDDAKFAKYQKERTVAKFHHLSNFVVNNECGDPKDIVYLVAPEGRNIDGMLDAHAMIQRALALPRYFRVTDCLMLRLYYLEDKRMHEIGAMFDISESRVSQLLSGITRRLRAVYQGANASHIQELVKLQHGPLPGKARSYGSPRFARTMRDTNHVTHDTIQRMLAEGCSVMDAIILKLYYVEKLEAKHIAPVIGLANPQAIYRRRHVLDYKLSQLQAA